MKWNVIVAVMALSMSAVSLFAAIPVIESIEPNNGSVAGGTVVTLRGKNLAAGSSLPIPCPLPSCSSKPLVTIGGKKAEIVESTADGTSIKIKTPPNAGGTYDVSFSSKGGSFTLGYVLLPSDTGTITLNGAFTYGKAGYERFLVPFYVDGEIPGAFGSRWVTELVGWNPHPFSVPVYQVPPDTVPFPIDDPTSDWGKPFSSFRPQLTGSGPAFLHVSEIFGDRPLAFHLRVRDITRQNESWGTEIPVISERKAFVGEPVLLNDIPNGGDARAMLRIYDFDGPTGGDIDVEIHLNEGNGGLSEQFLVARVDFPSGSYEQYPSAPGYIQMDLTSELADIPLAKNATSLRVSVSSPHTDKRLWAFVSVTNNRTQQITTITPQH